MNQRIRFYVLQLSLGIGLFSLTISAAPSQLMSVRSEVRHDVSPAVRDLPKVSGVKVKPHEAEPVRRIPLPLGLNPPGAPDLVLQKQAVNPPSKLTPVTSLNMDGIGQGVYGFNVGVVPPDTNGAVGSTQYVQWVNKAFAVFNKSTGALLTGPTAGNDLWKGFGGGCEANNNGDPIAVYDKLANRWVLSQFSVSTTPYLQCIAVSTTWDATGTYNRYAFEYTHFDDYPKMGVWPDAYYVTFIMFDGNTMLGADACAYDRNAMLNGQAATQVCFQQGSDVGSLLPSDLDGTTAPPAGSPNYMLTFGTNSLPLYKFHVDFVTPANSTFTGPTNISVSPFAPLCNGGACVPQSETTNQLDSLADRLMYRLAYRNFGDHESLVVNQSVAVDASGGIRWYEIQSPNGTPVVAQQSTFAPDSNYRWMGSVAMDHVGDLAVGYSVSSDTMFPAVRFAGRIPTDPPSTLEAETTIIDGTGSQTSRNRWGDYSAMQVDPVDDCTFWYTTEYLKNNGSFNWNTRIANFKFSTCASGPGTHVHQLYYNNSNWSDQDLTALTNGAFASPSALTSFADIHGEHAVFVATNQHVHQLYSNNSNWSDDDLTALTNGALASPSALTSFADIHGEHAVFVATNQHVHQLYYNNSNWSDDDLTTLTNGALASPSSALTSFADIHGEHAVFVATNQHVHQLYYNNSNWSDQDLTVLTNGALASPSALTSFADDHGEHVFFIATNQHVHQLYYNNSNWSDQDLTALTNGALASPSALTSFADLHGEHAVFVDTNQHIHQLYYTSNWSDQDLTALTNGALPSSGSGLSSFADSPGEHVFFVNTVAGPDTPSPRRAAARQNGRIPK